MKFNPRNVGPLRGQSCVSLPERFRFVLVYNGLERRRSTSRTVSHIKKYTTSLLPSKAITLPRNLSDSPNQVTGAVLAIENMQAQLSRENMDFQALAEVQRHEDFVGEADTKDCVPQPPRLCTR
jgi:hypothetical protein